MYREPSFMDGHEPFKFQKSERDVTVVITSGMKFELARELIWSAAQPQLGENFVKVTFLYMVDMENNPMPMGRVLDQRCKATFRLTFQRHDRVFASKELDEAMERVAHQTAKWKDLFWDSENLRWVSEPILKENEK